MKADVQERLAKENAEWDAVEAFRYERVIGARPPAGSAGRCQDGRDPQPYSVRELEAVTKALRYYNHNGTVPRLVATIEHMAGQVIRE